MVIIWVMVLIQGRILWEGFSVVLLSQTKFRRRTAPEWQGLWLILQSFIVMKRNTCTHSACVLCTLYVVHTCIHGCIHMHSHVMNMYMLMLVCARAYVSGAHVNFSRAAAAGVGDGPGLGHLESLLKLVL